MMRHSKQRQLILELVRANRGHPTADEIYEEARKHNPHISKGTVYRNLGLLIEEGILRGHRFDKDPERYDPILEEHSHFICRRCRKLIDLPVKPSVTMNSPLPDLPGYKVESSTLLFSGICADCLEKAKE